MPALNEALRLQYFRAVLGVRAVRLGLYRIHDSGADVAPQRCKTRGGACGAL